MAELIFLATAWGTKGGGINSFNMDFAKALSEVLNSEHRVACVVLHADKQDPKDPKSANVTVLKVGTTRDHDQFDVSLANAVFDAVESAGIVPSDNTWWIGHDVRTGDLANCIPEVRKVGRSALIHHMSYKAYQARKTGVSQEAMEKHDRQTLMFSKAHRIFAVGPLLRDRLKDMVRGRHDVNMIIPGLADIEPKEQPITFSAITFGRLDRENDSIKQGRLAVAAFATAYNKASVDKQPAKLAWSPELLLYGIDAPGGEQEEALKTLATTKANRGVNCLFLPYEEDRKKLFNKLSGCSVAMMLSWHEGFGLAGWEAIAAGVPLIVSANSGLYQLVKEGLGDEGLALFKAVDIRGWMDSCATDESTVREVLLELARDPDRAKRNALILRRRLRAKNFTWPDAARKFAKALGVEGLAPKAAPTKPKWTASPFPGLRPFSDKDSAIFYGRQREITRLTKKVADRRFVAVIGASGSGKSSLVWAGVLPSLPQHRWVRLTPAEADCNPIRALAGVIASDWRVRASAHVVEKALRSAPAQCERFVGQMLGGRPESSELLLFVDQFEELFTLVNSDLRKPFVDLLAVCIATGRVRVIATMRSEFYGHCIDSPDCGDILAEWLRDGSFPLASPVDAALYEMIEEPAKRAGLQFEQGLVDRIVEETGTKSGNLALMAFALEQLYQARCGEGMITWDFYERLGGVERAIGERAMETFEKLKIGLATDPQDLLGAVFHQLVDVDAGNGVATRRRAERAKVCRSEPTKRLVKEFVEARLLVTDSDQDSGAKGPRMIEVAHEALFRCWRLLATWIDERRDDLCLRSQLQRAAEEWNSRSRRTSHLWSDERAVATGKMLKRLPHEPTELESRFLGPTDRKQMLMHLEDSEITHDQRATIGVRLALLGDTRPGVGLREDGLPDIEWCEVADGTVTLAEDAGTFDVGRFRIARYAVTQLQFRSFVEAEDGYRNQKLWKGMGARRYQEPGGQFPALDNHPAVNILWCEAVAFCLWLTKRMKSAGAILVGHDIRLPTEWEWQLAAARNGENEQDVYPWGPHWIEKYANTHASKLDRPTAVGLYPHGKSHVGALDMAGNVWEWCLNEYAMPRRVELDGTNERVVRGGSWNSVADDVSALHRGHYALDYRNLNTGLRVVCGPNEWRSPAPD